MIIETKFNVEDKVFHPDHGVCEVACFAVLVGHNEGNLETIIAYDLIMGSTHIGRFKEERLQKVR
jgi:hypothetical protein